MQMMEMKVCMMLNCWGDCDCCAMIIVEDGIGVGSIDKGGQELQVFTTNVGFGIVLEFPFDRKFGGGRIHSRVRKVSVVEGNGVGLFGGGLVTFVVVLNSNEC